MICRRIFLEGTGATLVGFWWGSKNDENAITASPEGVKVEDIAEEKPSFKRRYTATINSFISMKIEIKNAHGSGVYTSGELNQTGGKWVLFDPESPADKILDREILPIIQKYCDKILEFDQSFRRRNPIEFVDEDGVKWRRVSDS